MARLVIWLAVGFACALGVFVVAGLLCKTGEKLRALRRAGWACVIAAIIATIHGGTKNILARFSADEGITVTSAEFTRATNDVEQTLLVYSYTGGTPTSPLWVRQTVSNEWEHLGAEWQVDSRATVNGTNVVSLYVAPPASNYFPFAMYWVGDNPPPVEIEESGGVEILAFRMTSRFVEMTYAVDGAVLHGKVGTVRVERSERDNVWIEDYATNHTSTVTNTLTGSGFFVDRTTKWRVRMEVPL